MAMDMDVVYNQYGQRGADERREVRPPIELKRQRGRREGFGLLGTRARRMVGTVPGPDGRRLWIKAKNLRRTAGKALRQAQGGGPAHGARSTAQGACRPIQHRIYASGRMLEKLRARSQESVLRSGGCKEVAGSPPKIVEIDSADLRGLREPRRQIQGLINQRCLESRPPPGPCHAESSPRCAQMIGSLMPSTQTLVRWPSLVRPERGSSA